jgi:glycerol-3-phosphate dehydrogenase
MKRAALLESLSRQSVYDLAVVGGGATGLGVALDAVLRGFSVVLLESHDFGSGTSSRSTKLLHGGVRYLAQGNLSLVREALAERGTVLRLAPHLAQPLSFVMPAYHWWQSPFYGIGLKLYDLLAGAAGLGRTELLSRERTLASLPGVNPQNLLGGVRYWDGQFDDARLVLALGRTAEAAGAVLMNYSKVTAVRRQADSAGCARSFLGRSPHRGRPVCRQRHGRVGGRIARRHPGTSSADPCASHGQSQSGCACGGGPDLPGG